MQVLQEDDDPLDEESLLEPPPMPNIDIFLITLSDEHFGQETAVVENTSFSNSSLHLLHLYSYMGISYSLITINYSLFTIHCFLGTFSQSSKNIFIPISVNGCFDSWSITL